MKKGAVNMTKLESYKKWVETTAAAETTQFCGLGFEEGYCTQEGGKRMCKNKNCFNCLKDYLRLKENDLPF